MVTEFDSALSSKTLGQLYMGLLFTVYSLFMNVQKSNFAYYKIRTNTIKGYP